MVVQLLLNLRVDSPLVDTSGVFCHQGEECSSRVPVLAERTCTASVIHTLPTGERWCWWAAIQKVVHMASRVVRGVKSSASAPGLQDRGSIWIYLSKNASVVASWTAEIFPERNALWKLTQITLLALYLFSPPLERWRGKRQIGF